MEGTGGGGKRREWKGKKRMEDGRKRMGGWRERRGGREVEGGKEGMKGRERERINGMLTCMYRHQHDQAPRHASFSRQLPQTSTFCQQS